MKVEDVHLGGLDGEAVCCVVGNVFLEIPTRELVRLAEDAKEAGTSSGACEVRATVVEE